MASDEQRELVRTGRELLGGAHSEAAKKRRITWYTSLDRRQRPSLPTRRRAVSPKALIVIPNDVTRLEPIWHRLRSLLDESRSTELPAAVRHELDDVRAELLESVFDGPPLYHERRHDLDPGDPRLTIALDILCVLSVAEPDDPS